MVTTENTTTEYRYSPIDEMLTTLQELQDEFKDSQLDVSKILSKVESGLDRAADKLKAGKAAAGLSDTERCDIAAELILSWVAECEFDSVTELPAEWQEELIHEALEAVLLDVAFYSSWRGKAERLKPLLCIALVRADKESVAVASSGTGNRVMTSSDGFTWTARPAAADQEWRSICWAQQLGLLVAVSSTGGNQRVMTSSDGRNWTLRTAAATNSWTAICWAAELGLLVALSSSGKGNRVMTSPDGISWSSRSSAADNAWTSLCWSPQRELLVAVASSGSSRIMTSADGITWTVRSTPASISWRSICWSPQRSQFAAVSNSGTGNRVMVSP